MGYSSHAGVETLYLPHKPDCYTALFVLVRYGVQGVRPVSHRHEKRCIREVYCIYPRNYWLWVFMF